MYIKVKMIDNVRNYLANLLVGEVNPTSHRWWEAVIALVEGCDGKVLSFSSLDEKDKVINNNVNYFLVERVYQETDYYETETGFEIISKPEYLEMALEFLINKVILKK
jgi:hypothetical protein